MPRTSRKTVSRLRCVLHVTSKLCAATIAAGFTPGALRKATLSFCMLQSAKGTNKLTPKWEGPDWVAQVTRPGAVRLGTKDGIKMLNSWNIEHLRKFYP